MYPTKIISAIESRVLARAGYGVIYVVGFSGDPPDAPVKVGMAGDIAQRMAGFRTGNWREMGFHELLFVRDRVSEVVDRKIRDAWRADEDEQAIALMEEHAPDADSLYELERSIHAALTEKGLHQKREWFFGGPAAVVETAKNLLRSRALPFETCSSMKRRLKLWAMEAEEAARRFAAQKRVGYPTAHVVRR